MLKVPLVVPVSPGLDAVNVYPVPALLMLMPENVATPFTALTDTAPPRVPLFGLAPIASVTMLVANVCGLPPASSMVTATAGEMADPAAELDGCTVKTS